MLNEKRGRKRVIREQYDIKTNQRSKTDLQKRAVAKRLRGGQRRELRSGESGESTSLADRSKKRNFKIYFERENLEEVGRFRATNNMSI
jgi:hypothetical protein